MTKHNNYANPCVATIYKRQGLDGEDIYVLSYQDEEWELTATKDEVLEELSEHLELMRKGD